MQYSKSYQHADVSRVRREGLHMLNMFFHFRMHLVCWDMSHDGWSQTTDDSCRCDDADGWQTVIGCEHSAVSFTKVSRSSKLSFTCSQCSHNFVSVHNWHASATQNALTKPTTARRGSVHIGGSKSDTYAHAGETQMRSAHIFLTETERLAEVLSFSFGR